MIKVEIGDRIRFRAATRWSGAAVWRVVNGFWASTENPTVRYGGWSNFAVKRSEIIEVEKRGDRE